MANVSKFGYKNNSGNMTIKLGDSGVIFTEAEETQLQLQERFKDNITHLSTVEYIKNWSDLPST